MTVSGARLGRLGPDLGRAGNPAAAKHRPATKLKWCSRVRKRPHVFRSGSTEFVPAPARVADCENRLVTGPDAYDLIVPAGAHDPRRVVVGLPESDGGRADAGRR